MESTISDLIHQIDAFSADCERRQHTDTSDAWDLLRTIREKLDAVKQTGVGLKPVHVVTHIRGGLVSDVELPDGVTLEVWDYDVDGVDADRLHTDESGQKHTRITWGDDDSEPSEGSEA